MSGFLARISTRRPWTTIVVWIALVAVGFVLVFTMLDNANNDGVGTNGEGGVRRGIPIIEGRALGT